VTYSQPQTYQPNLEMKVHIPLRGPLCAFLSQHSANETNIYLFSSVRFVGTRHLSTAIKFSIISTFSTQLHKKNPKETSGNHDPAQTKENYTTKDH